MNRDLHLLQRRIRVARGQEPGDLLLTGGRVVNVFTQRVEPADDRHRRRLDRRRRAATTGRRSQTIALAGRAVLPGLIDSHMHLESTLLTPAELARLIVPHGTTTLISDSHEIGNVLGVPGIDLLLAASRGLPLDLFFMAPSCVPATTWEDAGAVLGPPEVRELLTRPRVLGLAEVMDIPAVLQGDPGVLEKIRAALRPRPRRGWACPGPGRAGPDGLRRPWASAPTTRPRPPRRAAPRPPSACWSRSAKAPIARNLDALLPLLAAGELGDDWCLVTDDIFPDDLRQQGHIDGLLRRVVAGGVPPAGAVRHATLVPARHYGLTDRGAVAPGYRADLVVVEDLHDFRPHLVLKDGQLVAREGQYLAEGPPSRLDTANTVRLAPLDESAFRLPLGDGDLPRHPDRPRSDRHPPRGAAGPPRGWLLGVRPRPGCRPDRQHRAAPGERPDRPGAGQRARPARPGPWARRWPTTRTT